ncbi:hypothetical protein, partial [Phormidium sp. CCY1219]|uniref:hypothetical protein n=1 Tax=Phormidium sp. CCY1219 TaxID=2886104 RepID=UPI002D1F8467
MTESLSKNQPSNCTEYLLKAQIIAWLKESLASESINEEVKQRIIVKFCVQIEGGNQSIENLEEVEEKLEPGLPRGMVGTTGDP